MFYIVQDEELKFYDDNQGKLVATLEFTPQLKDELVLETDIITATELELHPNKVIIGDVEVEINVQEYDEEGNPIMIIVEEEIEVPIYDEEGKIIGYETEIIKKEVPKTHKEVITVRGLVLNPDYEKEEAEKRKEYIKSLTCTKRVFALMLKELGVPYSQLKELIATNEDAQLEWDLCVELLRANPMLDLMGRQLGITSEQLDKLFLYANGEISLEEFKK